MITFTRLNNNTMVLPSVGNRMFHELTIISNSHLSYQVADKTFVHLAGATNYARKLIEEIIANESVEAERTPVWHDKRIKREM